MSSTQSLLWHIFSGFALGIDLNQKIHPDKFESERPDFLLIGVQGYDFVGKRIPWLKTILPYTLHGKPFVNIGNPNPRQDKASTTIEDIAINQGIAGKRLYWFDKLCSSWYSPFYTYQETASSWQQDSWQENFNHLQLFQPLTIVWKLPSFQTIPTSDNSARPSHQHGRP